MKMLRKACAVYGAPHPLTLFAFARGFLQVQNAAWVRFLTCANSGDLAGDMMR